MLLNEESRGNETILLGLDGFGDPETILLGLNGFGDPVTILPGLDGFGDPVTILLGLDGFGDPVTILLGLDGFGDPIPVSSACLFAGATSIFSAHRLPETSVHEPSLSIFFSSTSEPSNSISQ